MSLEFHKCNFYSTTSTVYDMVLLSPKQFKNLATITVQVKIPERDRSEFLKCL